MEQANCLIILFLTVLTTGCARCSPGVAYSVDEAGRKAALQEIYASDFEQKGFLPARSLTMGDPFDQWRSGAVASRPIRHPYALVVPAFSICEARAAVEAEAKTRDARAAGPILGRAWAFVFLEAFDDAERVLRIDEVRMEPRRLRVRYHFDRQRFGLLSVEPSYPALWIPLDGASAGNYRIEVIDGTNGACFTRAVHLGS